ncbi:RseA family anti-sigma factor [Oxalobacter vibrioformis]|uniref:RseA family anti-sigma factor n=1 Tax=Oxalobacter vibrioformis TaxID=933080 RepID=A0A9E9P3U9_9BURK|nr:RseA family anti-sigma factor [Oxalobacter vibrioformis]NLC24978.1 hypothetical protein [Oxalobacter sp.]WAW10635.1 RseA family anti-sigma factor [Oxalobacter vibrioformis]
MEKSAVKEQLSAMLDGELEGEAIDRVLHEFADRDLYETAGLYLQIGDVLRQGEAFMAPSCDLAVLIREYLKSESYLSVDLDETEDIRQKKRLIIEI